jgi:hypothetical protein
MNNIKTFLLPTGIGVLLVVLGAISAIWNEGLRAARAGPAPLSGFLIEFISFFVLVAIVLAIFRAIRDAA